MHPQTHDHRNTIEKKFSLKHPDMGVYDKFKFTARILRSRWFVLVCAIWIQCCSGSSYAFGIYSQTIKVALKYDQVNLDTLAVFKDIGANVGILSGIIFEHIAPWGVLAIGALQSGFGYLMIWLSVTGRVPPPAFWQMCFYMFLAANGQTYFNTATVVTSVQSFPRSRGTIIGLMKGFLGLSGAILTQLYRAIYSEDPSSFIFMLMWLPTAMTLACMFVVRPVQAPKQKNEAKNLYLMSTFGLLLAAYLMILIIVENSIALNHTARLITCAICGLVLLLPLGVANKSAREDASLEHSFCGPSSSSSSTPKESLLRGDSSSSPPVPVSVVVNSPVPPSERSGMPKNVCYSESEGVISSPDSEAADDEAPDKRDKPHKGEDFTCVQAVCTAEFWLLFVAMACGMGSGTTAIDNMGQIGASLGYSVRKVGTFISLLSIWNFLGRLGFGMISEIYLHRYGIPRPVFLALTQATMSIGHLMIAIAFPSSLYIGSVVIGLCYGAQWSLMPAITSEIFGLLRFGTLFNTIAIASPLGAYYLSVHVAGQIYDYEARKEKGIDTSNLGILRWFRSRELLCHGPNCFRLTFLIMAAVSIFGSLVCLVLVARTRRYYARVVYARLETKRMEEAGEGGLSAVVNPVGVRASYSRLLP